MMTESKGQALIGRLEAWFRGYLHTVDADLPLVLALWAIGSWVFDRFYSWPYLVVTAPTKGAGKTRVLELLKGLCRNPFLGVSPSPAFVLREVRSAAGHFTLLWDEAEAHAMSDAKSFFSEVMNSGYRRGQEIGRAKGDGTVRYPSYCPKAFALIGDPTGTIRDRSIVGEMVKGNAPREYVPEVAEGEAIALQDEIKALLMSGDGHAAAAAPAWLDTRDREIWGSVFGLAEWLRLDKATMARLQAFAADNVAGKLAVRRRVSDVAAEERAVDDAYAIRALRDLLSVIAEGEPAVFSAIAVERMRAIPTGPWRKFKGDGLTEIVLAGLVSRFGVEPKYVRMVKGKGAKLAKTGRGYVASAVRAGVVKGGV